MSGLCASVDHKGGQASSILNHPVWAGSQNYVCCNYDYKAISICIDLIFFSLSKNFHMLNFILSSQQPYENRAKSGISHIGREEDIFEFAF